MADIKTKKSLENTNILSKKSKKATDRRVSYLDMKIKDKQEHVFITNTQKQYEDRPYDDSDIIVLFIDACRYLPESVSMTQIC